ncbi:MAG: aminotransferase class IV [Clostridiaceae bacterium]|nr:aminotransferase class IV [Clostridiaceae bacterium]
MDDNAGKYVVHNGILRECTDKVSCELTQIEGRAAYEVIRIIDGVPLFFEDHYDRLTETLNAVGIRLNMSFAQLCENIRMLLEKSRSENCNVKISVFYETENQQLAYISKSYYPTVEETDAGVNTGLLQIERDNPNAKIINRSYKEAVAKKIAEGGFFEVLLADSKGRLTEGSKSNLFFIKDGRVLTAPGEYVLRGITRKYVFEACRNAGFEVKEQFVAADEIGQTEGAFLSGTSIKVLPIKAIDSLNLNSSANQVIAAVRREYDKLLEKYIENHVKIW